MVKSSVDGPIAARVYSISTSGPSLKEEATFVKEVHPVVYQGHAQRLSTLVDMALKDVFCRSYLRTELRRQGDQPVGKEFQDILNQDVIDVASLAKIRIHILAFFNGPDL